MAVDTANAQFVDYAVQADCIAPVPTGIASGDAWIVSLTQDVSSDGIFAPVGWTQVGTGIQNTGDGQYTAVFYKIAGSSESPTKFTNETGNPRPGVLVSLRVSGITGFDASGQASTVGGNTVSLGDASVTTTQDGDFVVFIAATDFNNTALPDFVAPTGYSGLRTHGNSNFSAIAIASTTASSAGVYTSSGASATYPTAGTTGDGATWLIAFKAAPTAISRIPIVFINNSLSELPSGDSVVDTSTGVTAHSALTGLGADDHPQYHNDARGDARYALLGHTLAPSKISQTSALGQQTISWGGSSWTPAFQSATGNVFESVQLATQSTDALNPVYIKNLITGMQANAVYQIDCFITIQFDNTGGFYISLETPSGCLNMVEITVSMTTGVIASGRLRTIFPSASSSTNICRVTANTNTTGVSAITTSRIVGIIRNGSSVGDCSIKFAPSTAGTIGSIQASSEMSIWKLA